MPAYFCGWCGRRVEGADASCSVWFPFDSIECAAGYGLRVGADHERRGDKAATGFRFATRGGRHAEKEQARGLRTRCPRCQSEEAFYLEHEGLKSFTCYSCGYEYDVLPNGRVLHSRDDKAKDFIVAGSEPSRGDGLMALRAALKVREERDSTGKPQRRSERSRSSGRKGEE